MKRQKMQISALFILTAFLSTSAFSVYGLTSTKSAGKVDAIASATQAAPKPAPPTPAPAPAPAPKPVVKPAAKPTPTPAPASATPVASSFTEAASGLSVLGKTLDLSGTPILRTTDGQLLLPLRKTSEALGYAVKWDDLRKAAILENDRVSITLYRDNSSYLRGSESYLLNRTPLTFKNSLYVPTGFFTQDPAYRIDLASDTVLVELARNEVTPPKAAPKEDDSDEDEEDDD